MDPIERPARMRSLRALVQVFARPTHPLVHALARAEADPSDAAKALETMPSRPRRRILASLATLLRNGRDTSEARDRPGPIASRKQGYG